MKHNLCISVSKDPQKNGIVQCKNISIREKLLTRLLGRKQKVMILIPGNTVSTVSITEVQEGGVVHVQPHVKGKEKQQYQGREYVLLPNIKKNQ